MHQTCQSRDSAVTFQRISKNRHPYQRFRRLVYVSSHTTHVRFATVDLNTFSSVSTLSIPVCHVPTLRQDYVDFWVNPSPDTPVDCLVQVLAVLYTGSTSASDVAQLSSLYGLYDIALRAVGFDAYRVTSTSLRLLQASKS